MRLIRLLSPVQSMSGDFASDAKRYFLSLEARGRGSHKLRGLQSDDRRWPFARKIAKLNTKSPRGGGQKSGGFEIAHRRRPHSGIFFWAPRFRCRSANSRFQILESNQQLPLRPEVPREHLFSWGAGAVKSLEFRSRDRWATTQAFPGNSEIFFSLDASCCVLRLAGGAKSSIDQRCGLFWPLDRLVPSPTKRAHTQWRTGCGNCGKYPRLRVFEPCSGGGLQRYRPVIGAPAARYIINA